MVLPRNARGADWPGDATLTMRAEADTLECRLNAGSDGQLAALKDTVARHLERFAFREGTLQFDWLDA